MRIYSTATAERDGQKIAPSLTRLGFVDLLQNRTVILTFKLTPFRTAFQRF
jgi:hypothetical protein